MYLSSCCRSPLLPKSLDRKPILAGVVVSSAGGALVSTGVGTGTNLRYHDERCQAEARTDEERRAGTQGKRERETSHYSLLKVLSRLFSLADLYPLSGFDC